MDIFMEKYDDLIIILNELKHNLFEKIDLNLIINLDLTLKEALIPGTIIKIPLLNNSYYEHKIIRIINFNDTDIIKNLGLKSNNNCGNLIIKYNIILPSKLNDSQAQAIKSLF